MIQDSLYLLTGTILPLIAIWILLFAIFKDGDITTLDTWFILCLLINAGTQSCQKYNQYITFGYCRGKFYREQCVLSLVRGGIVAAFRTLVQIFFCENYIQVYTFGMEEDVSLYHQVSWIELFFTNFIIFLLVNMLFVLASTMYANSFVSKSEGKTLQQKVIQERKKHSSSNYPLWNCVSDR